MENVRIKHIEARFFYDALIEKITSISLLATKDFDEKTVPSKQLHLKVYFVIDRDGLCLESAEEKHAMLRRKFLAIIAAVPACLLLLKSPSSNHSIREMKGWLLKPEDLE